MSSSFVKFIFYGEVINNYICYNTLKVIYVIEET